MLDLILKHINLCPSFTDLKLPGPWSLTKVKREVRAMGADDVRTNVFGLIRFVACDGGGDGGCGGVRSLAAAASFYHFFYILLRQTCFT